MMQATERAKGLMSRCVMSRDSKLIVVREVWDLRAPRCPMVCLDKSRRFYTRDIYLSLDGYRQWFGEMADAAA